MSDLRQLNCVACGARTVSTVGKQVDGKWYCYNCAPARTAVVTDRTPIPNPSNANTVDARYFRQLLGDYVACLNALNEFATSHKIDPLTQGELASVKDAARDRLFMWGRPTPDETGAGAATICGHHECDNDSVLGECSRTSEKAFDRCAHGNVANECPHPHTDIR